MPFLYLFSKPDIVPIPQPKTVEAFGALLSQGTIGLGLGLALLATVLLFFGRSRSVEFMMFAAFLIVLGSGLEYVRLKSSEDIERQKFPLPDAVWDVFVQAQENIIFPKYQPFPTLVSVILKKESAYVLKVKIPAGQCRYYVAAIKPPATLKITWKPETVSHQLRVQRDYLIAGELCAPSDQDVDADVAAEAPTIEGQFSIAALAPPDPMRGPPDTTSKPTPSLRTKVVCTGEFEGACSAHDQWFPCPNIPDQEVGVRVCGKPASAMRRIDARGGNQCGYSTILVECAP